MKIGISLMLVGIALVGCKDMHSGDADSEFRGGPSSTVCGVRWSHDVTTFYCDGPKLRLDELRPFTEVQSVHFTATVVTRGLGARLDTVTNLALHRSKIDARLLASTFPRLRALALDGTRIDVVGLRVLDKLRYLEFHKTAPPDVSSVVAIPNLTTLVLTFVECAVPGCAMPLAAEIRRLRPELEIQVDGDVLP